MTVIRVRCLRHVRLLSITLHNFVTNTFQENGVRHWPEFSRRFNAVVRWREKKKKEKKKGREKEEEKKNREKPALGPFGDKLLYDIGRFSCHAIHFHVVKWCYLKLRLILAGRTGCRDSFLRIGRDRLECAWIRVSLSLFLSLFVSTKSWKSPPSGNASPINF